MANYHVTKNYDLDKWGARREGATRVSEFFDTQAEAEQAAKEFSSNSGGGEVRSAEEVGPPGDAGSESPGEIQFCLLRRLLLAKN